MSHVAQKKELLARAWRIKRVEKGERAAAALAKPQSTRGKGRAGARGIAKHCFGRALAQACGRGGYEVPRAGRQAAIHRRSLGVLRRIPWRKIKKNFFKKKKQRKMKMKMKMGMKMEMKMKRTKNKQENEERTEAERQASPRLKSTSCPQRREIEKKDKKRQRPRLQQRTGGMGRGRSRLPKRCSGRTALLRPVARTPPSSPLLIELHARWGPPSAMRRLRHHSRGNTPR